LIDVFSAVCKKRGDAVLILIGDLGSAGDGIEGGIQAKVKELGIEDKVLFLGTAEDVSGYYQAFDLFILPSLYEGLGMVAVEAQVSGLPCVLSDRVPKEAKILDGVEFLPLNAGLDEWVQTICEVKSERRDYSAEVAKAGYEIACEAGKLQGLYLKFAESEEKR
jgi:glycosyltransferase involved in cell wall biosynthesis